MESFRILMRPFAMFSTLALMANILKRSASVDFSSMNIRVLAFGLILQTVRIVKRRRRSWKMDSFAIKIKTKTIKLVKLLLILTTLIQPIVKRWVELWIISQYITMKLFISSTFAWTASNRENCSVKLAKFSARIPRSATIQLQCRDVKTGSMHPLRNKYFRNLFYVQYLIYNFNLFYYFHIFFCWSTSQRQIEIKE